MYEGLWITVAKGLVSALLLLRTLPHAVVLALEMCDDGIVDIMVLVSVRTVDGESLCFRLCQRKKCDKDA